MVEPIKMPLGGLIHVGQRNHVSLDGRSVSDESICSHKGRKLAIRPFAKLHWTLVTVVFVVVIIIVFVLLSFSLHCFKNLLVTKLLSSILKLD